MPARVKKFYLFSARFSRYNWSMHANEKTCLIKTVHALWAQVLSRKKRVWVKFSKLQKNCSFGNTVVSKAANFWHPNASLCFNTKVFSKTVVFLQNYKNTLYPNWAPYSKLVVERVPAWNRWFVQIFMMLIRGCWWQNSIDESRVVNRFSEKNYLPLGEKRWRRAGGTRASSWWVLGKPTYFRWSWVS